MLHFSNIIKKSMYVWFTLRQEKKHDGIKSQNYDITGEEGKEKRNRGK